jgi:hypothetical protein
MPAPAPGQMQSSPPFVDNIVAAGSTMSNAAQLPYTLSVGGSVFAVYRITSGAANSGVGLPSSVPNSAVTAINSSGSGKYLYPAQSEPNTTLNGFPGSNGLLIQPNAIGIVYCLQSGAWWTEVQTPVNAIYNTDASAASFTMPAADIVGAQAFVVLALIGALGANATATLPSAAATIAATHSPAVGDSWNLRIRNVASGFQWTIAAGTNFTLGTGTYTIANNTFRDFIVTVTGTNSMTLQDIGGGTIS